MTINLQSYSRLKAVIVILKNWIRINIIKIKENSNKHESTPEYSQNGINAKDNLDSTSEIFSMPLVQSSINQLSHNRQICNSRFFSSTIR